MVKVYKLEFTLLQQEILKYLFVKSGKSFNARGLAIPLERTQAGIIKALPELEKKELIKIKKDKESGRWAIELNRDNSKTIDLKRVENLKTVYESGLSYFLEEKFPGSIIILFGSYSYGEDTINSDIDIAIIGSKEKKVELNKFEKFLDREIRINFYNNINEINKNLRSNIFNGIILSGRIGL
ncbi:hypothetical protein COU53_01045 [Candidatus Pacearchaeota archaeon CG10_big_fil_rev_8_21_14_0_10_30_48]|nr:MAG: hypothetical protein COU53_01045 [Candidatus Pacearchaeota archaeon CG10_big_fil_rev_8_21_14_0_10_30_48]